jgi:hypothetical protein
MKQADSKSRKANLNERNTVTRLCEHCDKSVGIGHGVWRGDKSRPETLRLFHADPSECAEPKRKHVLTPEHLAAMQAARQINA